MAAIMARSLARDGLRVVAMDADPNPNLGIALGLGMERTARLDAVVNILITEGGHKHLYDDSPIPPDREAERLLERFGVVGPDGVWLVQTGRIERPTAGCLCCGSHRSTRQMFGDLHHEDRVVLADLEAGVLDLMWADPEPDTIVVVVTSPDRASLETAARTIAVATDLGVESIVAVANRLEMPDDLESCRRVLGPVPVTGVPEDRQVAAAARHGWSVVDADPTCPAVEAVRGLATSLRESSASRRDASR